MNFYGQRYLEYLKLEQNMQNFSEYPQVSLLATFASNWPFISYQHQTIRRQDKKKRFVKDWNEQIKKRRKRFLKIEAKKIFKNLSFFRNPLNILLYNLY